ncbi:MAG: dihydroorotase [Alphaproteobacteria bacterium]|nr:dihydroorotase [Alphaproteobacteria bacterium]
MDKTTNEALDLLLLDGQVLLGPERLEETSIAIRGGEIVGLGVSRETSAREVVSARGLTVMPGVLDTQVHFREPGFPEKETLADGMRAAALGGVVGVFEMPNTRPPTTDAAALEDKLSRVAGRAYTDYAFYVGATPDNLTTLGDLELLDGVAGVKLFMGSSTGGLLVSGDDEIFAALRSGKRRMAIHSEDESRLRSRRSLVEGSGDVSLHPEWRDVETARLATERVTGLAKRAGRAVHVLHVTTAEELEILAAAKPLVSAEVTPQHLTLTAPDCYERLGTLAQMNPPIRDARHCEALWRGVREGVLDVIGSDHAPHTLAEKGGEYPATPSGMPGVQTLLPLMLDHVARGRLSLWRLSEMVSLNPARLFGMRGCGAISVGRRADLTLVDLGRREVISKDWLSYRCGWSPFEGVGVTGWPVMSILRGRVLLREGELSGAPFGEAFRFGG